DSGGGGGGAGQGRVGGGLQEIDAAALAVVRERQCLGVGRIRLHVVDRGYAVRRVLERRVLRHIVDALVADIDDAAVVEALEVLLAGSQHDASLARGVSYPRVLQGAFACRARSRQSQIYASIQAFVKMISRRRVVGWLGRRQRRALPQSSHGSYVMAQ